MKDVRVPQSNMLPKAKGLGPPMNAITLARLAISWGVIGAAEDCLKKAVEYSLSRKQFDSVIGGYQLVQMKLANIVTEISLATFASLQVTRLMEQN